MHTLKAMMIFSSVTAALADLSYQLPFRYFDKEHTLSLNVSNVSSKALISSSIQYKLISLHSSDEQLPVLVGSHYQIYLQNLKQIKPGLKQLKLEATSQLIFDFHQSLNMFPYVALASHGKLNLGYALYQQKQQINRTMKSQSEIWNNCLLPGEKDLLDQIEQYLCTTDASSKYGTASESLRESGACFLP